MSSITQACSLEQAIRYQNDDIVYRFTQIYEIDFNEANDLFLSTKKWLWLGAQAGSTEIPVTEPLLIIDEMWHNFVLFTVEYRNYCVENFGRYLHHAPRKQSDKLVREQALMTNPEKIKAEESQILNQQCLLICQKLGVDTLLKWYVEYPQKYNEDFFNNHRKKTSLGWTPTPDLQKLTDSIKAGRVVISQSA